MSKKIEHTPGPWRKAGFSIVKGSGHRHTIADTYMQGSADMTNSNARLMATAPELLEACQSLLALCQGGVGNALQIMDQARAAIAKAKGEQ